MEVVCKVANIWSKLEIVRAELEDSVTWETSLNNVRRSNQLAAKTPDRPECHLQMATNSGIVNVSGILSVGNVCAVFVDRVVIHSSFKPSFTSLSLVAVTRSSNFST